MSLSPLTDGVTTDSLDIRRLEIHTSDRNSFLRCRRKWDWQSISRRGLQSKGNIPAPLWFGSGFHFALEDYHGLQHFTTPYEAFCAYADAFSKEQLPIETDELLMLAKGMLEHYAVWEERRERLTTLWAPTSSQEQLNPLVEYDWRLPIPGLFNVRGQQVYAAGTFDRIAHDESQRLWVVDYKTAASFNVAKQETDIQITNYTWAATTIFGTRFEGCIWQSHLKATPALPEPLKSGGLSVNKQQRTTHALYREALAKIYPGRPSSEWDPKYVEFLNHLSEQEHENADRFIRRDFVRRNEAQLLNEVRNLYAVATDMLDPNISIYPHFTPDCAWDCPFQTACFATEDDADPESILTSNFEPLKEWNGWRKKIKYPSL